MGGGGGRGKESLAIASSSLVNSGLTGEKKGGGPTEKRPVACPGRIC